MAEDIQLGERSQRREAQGAGAADAAIDAAEKVYLEAQLSPEVVQALGRWRDIDDPTLANLEAALTSSGGTFAPPGLVHALEGFTAEEIAAEELDLTLPAKTNIEAWDLQSGDQLIQVKEGSTAYEHARAAADSHPEITIATDGKTAELLREHGIEALAVDGLAPEAVQAMTHGFLEALDQLGSITLGVPPATALLVTIRELRAVKAGDQDMPSAIANITTLVGTRSVAFALVGVVIATSVTATPTVLFVATIGGMFAASYVSGKAAHGLIATGIPRNAAVAAQRVAGGSLARWHQHFREPIVVPAELAREIHALSIFVCHSPGASTIYRSFCEDEQAARLHTWWHWRQVPIRMRAAAIARDTTSTAAEYGAMGARALRVRSILTLEGVRKARRKARDFFGSSTAQVSTDG